MDVLELPSRNLRLVDPSSESESGRPWLLVHGVRTGFLVCILLVSVVYQIRLGNFLDVDTWLPVYATLFAGFLANAVYLLFFEGHLVFATLHTNSAISTITRVVNVFPSDQQDRIRTQLSLTLNATISQRLIPAIKGGMAVALEILILNPSIRNLIRENKLHQVYGMMQVGQDKTGMITLNQSLLQLVMKRKIEVRTAFAYSSDPEELDKMLKQAGV